ncbi:MAG: rhamnulokinase family protein [Gallicola sp.]|nr:rhamnulokinase family protein [Gallicola sp.]
MKKVLAIDMGATSIRGIVGYVENGTLRLEEVMRLSHSIIDKDGRRYWEWEKLISTIEETVLKCDEEIVSIGVDTWGVDFGLLNENEELIQPPLSYRDESNGIGYEEVKKKMDFYQLYRKTGNQIMNINSLFQLMTMKKLQPEVLDKAKTLLMMPDLVNFYLTGEKVGEKTICSTTQMFNLKDGEWNQEVLKELGFDKGIFPEIIENKRVIGNTKNAKKPKLRKKEIDVISVASHDTASAVAITKAYGDSNTLFLSSGTWSLLGCYTEEPVLTQEAFTFNLTNETGYNGRNMFFQNVTGLYLIEKLIRELEEREGKRYSYEEITAMVKNTKPFKAIIDIQEEIFGQETESFIGDVEDYLIKTGQEVLARKTDYFSVIYESMVLYYKKLVDYLQNVTGRTFKRIHIIGGGSQSDLLCQLIADGLHLEVVAGPKEATAIGNILAQLERIYKPEEKEMLLEAIDKANELTTYFPRNWDQWKEIKGL